MLFLLNWICKDFKICQCLNFPKTVIFSWKQKSRVLWGCPFFDENYHWTWNSFFVAYNCWSCQKPLTRTLVSKQFVVSVRFCSIIVRETWAFWLMVRLLEVSGFVEEAEQVDSTTPTLSQIPVKEHLSRCLYVFPLLLSLSLKKIVEMPREYTFIVWDNTSFLVIWAYANKVTVFLKKLYVVNCVKCPFCYALLD